MITPSGVTARRDSTGGYLFGFPPGTDPADAARWAAVFLAAHPPATDPSRTVRDAVDLLQAAMDACDGVAGNAGLLNRLDALQDELTDYYGDPLDTPAAVAAATALLGREQRRLVDQPPAVKAEAMRADLGRYFARCRAERRLSSQDAVDDSNL